MSTRRGLITLALLLALGAVVILVRDLYGPGYVAGFVLAAAGWGAYLRGLYDGRTGDRW